MRRSRIDEAAEAQDELREEIEDIVLLDQMVVMRWCGVDG